MGIERYTSRTELRDKMRCCTRMMTARGSEFCTDVAQKLGGRGEMPTPGEMLAATVASCMMSMLAFTAMKKNIPMQDASISAACGEGKSGIGILHFHLRLPHVRDEEHKRILQACISACPVGNAIRPEIEKEMVWQWE